MSELKDKPEIVQLINFTNNEFVYTPTKVLATKFSGALWYWDACINAYKMLDMSKKEDRVKLAMHEYYMTNKHYARMYRKYSKAATKVIKEEMSTYLMSCIETLTQNGVPTDVTKGLESKISLVFGVNSQFLKILGK